MAVGTATVTALPPGVAASSSGAITFTGLATAGIAARRIYLVRAGGLVPVQLGMRSGAGITWLSP